MGSAGKKSSWCMGGGSGEGWKEGGNMDGWDTSLWGDLSACHCISGLQFGVFALGKSFMFTLKVPNA